MYKLVCKKDNFKLFQKPSDKDTISLAITGKSSYDIIPEFRKIIKDEKKCRNFHPKIDEYRFIMTDKHNPHIDFYYIAYDCENPHLMIDPVDIIVSIEQSENKIIIKSVDDLKLLANDKYERIKNLNIKIEVDDDKKIKCKLTYKSSEEIINIIQLETLFDFMIKILRMKEKENERK